MRNDIYLRMNLQTDSKFYNRVLSHSTDKISKSFVQHTVRSQKLSTLNINFQKLQQLSLYILRAHLHVFSQYENDSSTNEDNFNFRAFRNEKNHPSQFLSCLPYHRFKRKKERKTKNQYQE